MTPADPPVLRSLTPCDSNPLWVTSALQTPVPLCGWFPLCLLKCEERGPRSLSFFFWCEQWSASSCPFCCSLVREHPNTLASGGCRWEKTQSALLFSTISDTQSFLLKQLFHHTVVITAVNHALPVVTNAASVSVGTGLIFALLVSCCYNQSLKENKKWKAF